MNYSRFKDEKPWKVWFFCREDKQLLREACPRTRNGDQHRLIHRSLLEYGLACAIFDPQDIRTRSTPKASVGRRGSVGSILSIDTLDSFQDDATALGQEPDLDMPLVWRTFVNDHSLLQFLEERAQQEPLFKEQLLAISSFQRSTGSGVRRQLMLSPFWFGQACNSLTRICEVFESHKPISVMECLIQRSYRTRT